MNRRLAKVYLCLVAIIPAATGFMPPIDVASGFCWGVAFQLFFIGFVI